MSLKYLIDVNASLQMDESKNQISEGVESNNEVQQTEEIVTKDTEKKFTDNIESNSALTSGETNKESDIENDNQVPIKDINDSEIEKPVVASVIEQEPTPDIKSPSSNDSIQFTDAKSPTIAESTAPSIADIEKLNKDNTVIEKLSSQAKESDLKSGPSTNNDEKEIAINKKTSDSPDVINDVPDVVKNIPVEDKDVPDGVKNIPDGIQKIPEGQTVSLRKGDEQSATPVVDGIRKSLMMKTKGNIYYKKKGPFYQWKMQYVIIDESKQQMNFFKSSEDYDKLSRCKLCVDLRFVKEIIPYKQRLIQSKFPFKLQRRAGLSTVKLAADCEEERAKWITTIQEIVEALKASPERDLDINKRSTTLPNQAKSPGGASTDSETCTTSSAPDEVGLIRPQKVKSSGFKVNPNEISSIKLKRTSSENRRFQQETKKNDDETKETFGVSLRRVQTEKANATREKTPEYVEFKEKYNSLSLSRKAKSVKLPLNENSACSHLVESLQEEEAVALQRKVDKISPTENKETPRKRSPSPNIPISKGIETFVKNSQEEDDTKREISHATEIVLEIDNLKDLVEEDIKECHDINNTMELTTDEQNSNNITHIETIIPSINVEKCAEQSKDEHNRDRKQDDLVVQMSTCTVKESICPKTDSVDHVPHEEMGSKQNLFSVDDPSSEESNENSISEQIIEEDPLKVNAIKQFIVKMNSDADENCLETTAEVLQVNINDIEKSIPPTETNELRASSESNPKEGVRLSSHSYVSQFSTESDEPLPKLNFMGKSDRSSSGSLILKENLISENGKFDTEEPIIREKPKIMKRPDSINSIGIRSSLVSPAFTVVEEKAEDFEYISKKKEEIEVHNSNETSLKSSEQIPAPQPVFRPQDMEPCSNLKDEIYKKNAEMILEKPETVEEKSKEIISTDHICDNKAEKFNEALDTLNMESISEDVKEIKITDKSITAQNDIVLHEAPEQLTEIFPEEVITEDINLNDEASSGRESKDSCIGIDCQKNECTNIASDEKIHIKAPLYVNKIEMNLCSSSTKPKTPEKYSTVTQTNFAALIHSADEITVSDNNFEVIEGEEETADFFPTIGEPRTDVELRQKDEPLKILCTPNEQSMRTSGIQGLKEYLEDNKSDQMDVKSGISRLGRSAAIEKLKTEIPKQS